MNIFPNTFQFTGTLIAKPAPATAPTIEWLVEIGILQQVAKTTQAQAANTETMATYKETVLSNVDIATILLPTVLATWPPCRKAPKKPREQIRIIACVSVNTFEPTAVPKELAASLAPIDQPMAAAITKSRKINNKYIFRFKLGTGNRSF